MTMLKRSTECLLARDGSLSESSLAGHQAGPARGDGKAEMTEPRYLATSDRFHGDTPGGGYKIAWELARLAAREGYRAALVCGSDEPRSPLDEQDGVHLVRYPIPRGSRLDPRRLARHVEAIHSSIRDHLGPAPFDVVHSHMLLGGLALRGWKKPGGRAIATVHSPAILEQKINWRDGSAAGEVKWALGGPALWWRERELYHAADRVTTLSQYTARELGRLYGARIHAKVVCIPWWSEFSGRTHTAQEARQALGWKSGERAFFTLRRLTPRMGLDTLIDAVALLNRKAETARFYIGGAGPQRESLEARARGAGIASRVQFLGRMTDQEVRLAYEAAEAFILPTRSLECFGIIALDALAMGCPVLGARVGAIPEMLEPILPGWLFEPDDPRALAALLGKVLDEKLPRPSPAELARHAQSRYSRARIERAYLDLMSGEGAPGECLAETAP
jgi:glycosyltransferase involved in cell wall biosynthesis